MVDILRSGPPLLWGYGWRQHIGQSPGWEGDLNFGPDSSSCVYPIDMYWDDFTSGFNDGVIGGPVGTILGYGAKLPSGDLSRVLPTQHPFMNAFRAARVVRAEPIQPVTLSPKILYPNGYHQRYTYIRLWVLFQVPKWQVLADSDLDTLYPREAGITRQEWQRWTIKIPASATQIANTDRQAYVWAAGPANTQPVELGPSIIIVKARLRWQTMYLPDHPGIMDANGIHSNILKVVGKVNSDVFAGFPKGTLLMEDPDIQPADWPFSPTVFGYDPIFIPRTWNVTFSMVFFDPLDTLHGNADGGGNNPALPGTNGHNLSLYAPDGQTSGWYPIKSTHSSNPPFPSTTFATAWTMV